MSKNDNRAPLVDNRGTDDCPFGYVYLDGTRVGFTKGEGVWLTRGWHAENSHLVKAKAWLDETMPGWNDPIEIMDEKPETD